MRRIGRATFETEKIAEPISVRTTNRPTIKAKFEATGANPMSKKDTIAFSGTATINRSEFGVGMGVPMVADKVDLKITAAFEKQ